MSTRRMSRLAVAVTIVATAACSGDSPMAPKPAASLSANFSATEHLGRTRVLHGSDGSTYTIDHDRGSISDGRGRVRQVNSDDLAKLERAFDRLDAIGSRIRELKAANPARYAAAERSSQAANVRTRMLTFGARRSATVRVGGTPLTPGGSPWSAASHMISPQSASGLAASADVYDDGGSDYCTDLALAIYYASQAYFRDLREFDATLGGIVGGVEGFDMPTTKQVVGFDGLAADIDMLYTELNIFVVQSNTAGCRNQPADVSDAGSGGGGPLTFGTDECDEETVEVDISYDNGGTWVPLYVGPPTDCTWTM